MVRPIAVGDMVHGHLGGWLGRDWYGCARIEALGADWVVVRDEAGKAFATATRGDGMNHLHRELVRSRDNFELWFCEHQRPDMEDE